MINHDLFFPVVGLLLRFLILNLHMIFRLRLLIFLLFITVCNLPPLSGLIWFFGPVPRYILVRLYAEQYTCAYGVQLVPSKRWSPTFGMGPLCRPHIYLLQGVSDASPLLLASVLCRKTTFDIKMNLMIRSVETCDEPRNSIRTLLVLLFHRCFTRKPYCPVGSSTSLRCSYSFQLLMYTLAFLKIYSPKYLSIYVIPSRTLPSRFWRAPSQTPPASFTLVQRLGLKPEHQSPLLLLFIIGDSRLLMEHFNWRFK